MNIVLLVDFNFSIHIQEDEPRLCFNFERAAQVFGEFALRFCSLNASSFTICTLLTYEPKLLYRGDREKTFYKSE